MENGTPGTSQAAGETTTPGDSKTQVSATTPAQGNVVDPAELERQRKAAEQAQMRANQLENELKRIKDEQAAQKAKELEEQNQYKSLYEQEKARLEEITSQQEAQKRQAELAQATDSVLGEFSQEVVEIAKETGLGLTDDSDEAKAALKAKLENIQKKVVKTSTPAPNNPNPNMAQPADAQKLETLRYGEGQVRQQVANDLIGNLAAVKAMKAMAGYQDQ